jgi:hypothetical protein
MGQLTRQKSYRYWGYGHIVVPGHTVFLELAVNANEEKLICNYMNKDSLG